MKWRCREEMSHRRLAWAAKWCCTAAIGTVLSDIASGAVLRIRGLVRAACRRRSCRGEAWGRHQPCFPVAPHRCPGPWMLHDMLETTTGRGNQLSAFLGLLWIPRGGLHVCKHQQPQIIAGPKALEEYMLFCAVVQPLQHTSMRFPNFPKASAPIVYLVFPKHITTLTFYNTHCQIQLSSLTPYIWSLSISSSCWDFQEVVI